MIRQLSPRLLAYAAIGAAGLLVALLGGRPEVAALAAPLIVFAAVGAAASREPRLRIRLELAAERALEGEAVPTELQVTAADALERLDLLLIPSGLEPSPPLPPVALRVGRGETRSIPFSLRCTRWGAYAPGELVVRVHDALDLVQHHAPVDCRVPLRVYPTVERLRALLRPLEPQLTSGDDLARAKGDGIEFADIRPFMPGDQVRRIAWRASARRGSLHVTESHPERNTDVVLFLDTLDTLSVDGRSGLDAAVRAAGSLASFYLRGRDRVGVVSFGGDVSWLAPALGAHQLERVVESLLESEGAHSYLWQRIDVVPPRVIPPNALVIALTPLTDWRMRHALVDLRARGCDLVVLEVPAARSEQAHGDAEVLAHRLWSLWREAVRYRFERLGIPVVELRDGDLGRALQEVIACRRSARRMRA
jgi:uncharacterized protein (DUF58 family)